MAMTISLDFETAGLFGPPVCFTFADENGPHIMHGRDKRAEQTLRNILTVCNIVGHNIAYDTWTIAQYYPALRDVLCDAYDEGRIHDTGIRDKLFVIATADPRLAALSDGDDDDESGRTMFSLADLCMLYFGLHVEKEDTWRLRYHELMDIPVDQWPEEARKYALDDATLTRAVWAYQEAHTIPTGLIKCEDEVCRTHFALQVCARHGLYTDAGRVDAFEAKLRAQKAELEEDLLKVGFISRNKKTGELKREMKFTKQFVLDNEPNVKYTKAVKNRKSLKPFVPQVSLSKKDVETYDHPQLLKYCAFGSLQTQLGDGQTKGKVAELRANGTYRIQNTYDPMKVTGRTGAKKPNVQNFSRSSGIRDCIVAPPGMCIVGADYTSLEMYSLAEVLVAWFGQSNLAEALWAGKDTHCIMAADIMGWTYEQVLGAVNAGYEPAKEARQLGKIPNFGFPGGLGYKRFVDFARGFGQRITEAEARKLKAIFMRNWHEMDLYFKRIDALVKPTDARIQGLYDGIIKGKPGYCDACNFMFQNLGARAATRALWLVVRASLARPDSALYGTEPCIFVHDEIHVRCAIERCHDVGMELSKLMEQGAAEYLRLCPPPAPPYAMLSWNKKAKAVYNEEGRLVPWTPEMEPKKK